MSDRPVSVKDYPAGGSCDVLLVQPPVLPPDSPATGVTDPVVRRYWDLLYRVDRRYSDQIAEPSIGVLSLAGALRERGFSVRYVDLHILDLHLRETESRAVNERDVERCLSGWSAPVVGLTAMASNFGWARRVARVARRALPDSTMVLGGVHATLVGKAVLDECPEVDVLVIGEGEVTGPELLSRLLHGPGRGSDPPGRGGDPSCLDEVAGLVYRGRSGGAVATPPRPEIADLDSLAYPAYDLVPLEAHPIIFRVAACRGCAGNCKFCSMRAFWKGRARRRDPRRVVDEVEHWHREWGCRRFMMGDLTFMQDREHSGRICEELIRRKLDVEWWCQIRSGGLTPEDALLLRRAGCTQVAFGVESGDQAVLDGVRKGIRSEGSEETCRLLKRFGFFVQAYFLIGLPGETLASAMETVRLIDRLLAEDMLDVTHISFLVPFPGTELYDRAEENGLHIVSRDYDTYFTGVSKYILMLPVARTDHLDTHQIRALWQLALAVASGHYQRRIDLGG